MDRRKQLKKEYKMNPQPMGVYQIRNQISGKVFVGASMNLVGTKNGYRAYLDMKANRYRALLPDWNAFGPDNFVFEILETLDISELPQADWRNAVAEMEQKWLDLLQPYDDKGYNLP
ncbi:MAG: GIY-YIG nuclease family protein [Solirubrobacterales bacterium]